MVLPLFNYVLQMGVYMSQELNQKVEEESGQIAKEEAERSGPSVTEEEMMSEEKMS